MPEKSPTRQVMSSSWQKLIRESTTSATLPSFLGLTVRRLPFSTKLFSRGQSECYDFPMSAWGLVTVGSKLTWNSPLLLTSRPEERDTFTLSLHTIDLSSSTGQISYPLIASIPNLPSSSLSLFPCPPQISGVVLLSPNAIIHIDPSGNTVATAVNAYHSHESSLLAETLPGVSGLRLEGAQVVFLEEGRKGLLLLSDGCIRELAFEKEGRMLVRIVVAEEDSERGPSPSAGVCSVSLGGEEGECTFVGSLLGDGSLLRIGRKAIGHSAGISVPVMEPTTLIDEENGMDLDDGTYPFFILVSSVLTTYNSQLT